MADCIGTGFPQFPCALVQMRYSIRENGCGHIFSWGVTLAVKKKVTGDKKGRRRKGEKGEGMYKASCHIGGNTNKKKK